MDTDRLPFFLGRVREWWGVAEALRARGVPEGDRALTVWREAAWCHLLLTAGRHQALVMWLRVVVREVTGVPAPENDLPGDEGETLRAAAELFDRLRTAVGARFPLASSLPSAA